MTFKTHQTIAMTWMHWQLAATLSSAPTTDKPANRQGLPELLFLTDDARTPDPLTAIMHLPQNCGVIFRHYEARDRVALAERCAALAKDQGRKFLIAGDYDLARDLHADGLHLPENMARQAPRMRQRQPTWHMTLAAHSFMAVRKAQSLDIDAVFASPVFPTQSHPDRSTLGIMRLAKWAKASRHPVYALGGVTKHNLLRLQGLGIGGIAAIGGLSPK